MAGDVGGLLLERLVFAGKGFQLRCPRSTHESQSHECNAPATAHPTAQHNPLPTQPILQTTTQPPSLRIHLATPPSIHFYCTPSPPHTPSRRIRLVSLDSISVPASVFHTAASAVLADTGTERHSYSLSQHRDRDPPNLVLCCTTATCAPTQPHVASAIPHSV